MRHVLKTNSNPLFKNLLDMDCGHTNKQSSQPNVNISEDEKTYKLSFATPGYKKEDLGVRLAQ